MAANVLLDLSTLLVDEDLPREALKLALLTVPVFTAAYLDRFALAALALMRPARHSAGP